ncbi:MAG: hypothetical protein ACI9AV_001699 [Sediminicola sp.]|jgi:hypothetical protein
MISKGIFLIIVGAIIAFIAYRMLEKNNSNMAINELGVSKKLRFKGYFGKFFGLVGVLVFYLGVLLLILRYSIS